ncbi:hypothetical protein [Streptomyces ortus]|uniref:Preprotein translocase YidC n=1 Tax=Streptomyces ortus TaxID=2867268 RepID=A0ABT3VBG2_9ACTN|nr:hypothetical protein [Streptomyces ortus]MCX4237275.1 hypothetical protein [Streptomyces ortus]
MSDDEQATAAVPEPEEPPARRRRTVRRRGGYMATGQVATDGVVLPSSVTVSEQPAVPAPESQDAADDEGADG